MNPLAETEAMLCEGSSHDSAIRLRLADYLELEKPVATRLSRRKAC